MKLWATVDLRKLPEILQKGLDNPYAEEIHFSSNAEQVAEYAIETADELAFIETEIPDDELNIFFVRCMASHGDHQTDLEMDLDNAESEEELAEMKAAIKAMEEAESAKELLDVFGYVCLYQAIPPAMLKLLDPAKMLEAVHSGNVDAVASAVQTAETTAFKSLNAAFWVWLMFLLGEIFGPGYGIPEAGVREEREEEEEEQLKKMRQKTAKRPRRKKKKKASKGA